MSSSDERDSADNVAVVAVRESAESAAAVGKARAKLDELYEWLDGFVVTHPEAYGLLDAGVRCALDEWCFEMYRSGLNGDVEVAPTGDSVVTLDEMLTGLAANERALYVLPCDCRVLHGSGVGVERETLEVCLSYRVDPVSGKAHPAARRVSCEEGMDIALRADQVGLIHTRSVDGRGATAGYCNCDPQWCYLFRLRTVRTGGRCEPDSSGWLTGTRRVSLVRETCNGCLRCVRRCPFAVLSANDEGGAVLVRLPETCVGCGLCVTTCPTGALSLAGR